MIFGDLCHCQTRYFQLSGTGIRLTRLASNSSPCGQVKWLVGSDLFPLINISHQMVSRKTQIISCLLLPANRLWPHFWRHSTVCCHLLGCKESVNDPESSKNIKILILSHRYVYTVLPASCFSSLWLFEYKLGRILNPWRKILRPSPVLKETCVVIVYRKLNHVAACSLIVS